MRPRRLLRPIAILATVAVVIGGTAVGASPSAPAAWKLGFEGTSAVPSDVQGSRLTLSNRVVHSGSRSLAERATSLSGGWDLDTDAAWDAPVSAGVQYTASLWARTPLSGVQVSLAMDLLGPAHQLLGTAAGQAGIGLQPDTWVQLSVMFVPSEGEDWASFHVSFSGAAPRHTIYWDDLAVTGSAAPPTNTTLPATTTTVPRTTTTVPRTTTTAGATTTAAPATTIASTTTTIQRTSGPRWVPPAGNVPWQWEIDHALSLTSASDMGTGATLPSGAPAPNPVVYDIDGFDNPASTVRALHGMGFHAICYIEVGAAEKYRPDYGQFPASTLGASMPGYSTERYVDIRSSTVVSIIEARIRMCATKGFDAIEPDIDESYASSTGFPLTQAVEESYMRTLTTYAHDAGVAMLMKNPDDTGDSYAADMEISTDGVLSEQCNEYSSCDLLTAYVAAGKAVFQVEYGLATGAFCPADDSRGFNGVKQNVNLNGGRQPCR